MFEPVYTIRIRKEGAPIEALLASFENKFKNDNIDKDLNKIKNTILDHTQKFIQAHRKRNIELHDEPWRFKKRNNLFNVIKEGTSLTRQGNYIVLGIGRMNPGKNTKACLKLNAPYWYKINYGGKIDMKGKEIFGYFGNGNRPMIGNGRETFKAKFIPGNYRTWKMEPKKLIPPMYYLNEMTKVADIEIALFLLSKTKRK